MKTLLKIVLFVVLLAGLAAGVSFFFPGSYRVERSITIRGDRESVMHRLADLREWKTWGAWYERDPGMAVSYSEKQEVRGAWSEWKSKSEGNGRMTLTEVTPVNLRYELVFPDYGMKSTGAMNLAADATTVRVTWTCEGELGNNPITRWMGLWLDGWIGKDFDASLAKLKKICEG